MAVVQLVDPLKPQNAGGRITRGMAAPKRVTSLDHWLKEARKVLKEIPRASECIVETTSTTPYGITFNLRRPDGSRVYVAIDRTRDGMTLR